MKELELYFHIPFCERKCAYCDFLSAPADPPVRISYIKKLQEEIAYYGPQFKEYQVSSIFFGGGTPTILEGYQLAAILETVKKYFHLVADAEITVECNPGTLTAGKAEKLVQAGFNRLSMGLQSADDRELQLLGRIHNFAQFLESYDLSGKTIVPFCTSQDNDISVSMDYIKEVASGANVLDGYRIHGADVDDVKEWLQRIGVLNDNNTENQNAEGSLEMKTKKSDKNYESATIPDELEYIPDGYEAPADQQGSLQKITYDTWESFTYDQKSQKLTKEAWVYVPYGYDENEKYNVFYLSHGGWSNETTIMGTDKDPHSFKNVMDHAIEDGKIKPLIIVLPTYNNTSEEDSGDYSLAIQLTNQFHNELVNDLIPAVESKFSTYAENVTEEGLEASRDHRGFGGFSMGSVNTWNTFRYCLDYFRYFMPMSGSYSTDGQYMADLVRQQGYGSDDFFIFSASGTNDFAYHAFKAQIMAMAQDSDGMFRFANNETDGNLSFLEREGYEHDQKACDEYTYNGLRFFWNAQ